MITLLAAVSNNGVIGDKDTIPWKLPSDMKHFKEYTMGKTLVMGRKTFESLPTLLEGRSCIVVSSKPELISAKVEEFKQKHPDRNVPEVMHAHSIRELFTVDWDDLNELVVVGGSTIYKQMYDYADKMLLTVVHLECEGDTTFGPRVEWDHWNKKHEECISRRKPEGDEYESSIVSFYRINSDNIYSLGSGLKLTKTEQIRLSLGI